MSEVQTVSQTLNQKSQRTIKMTLKFKSACSLKNTIITVRVEIIIYFSLYCNHYFNDKISVSTKVDFIAVSIFRAHQLQ